MPGLVDVPLEALSPRRFADVLTAQQWSRVQGAGRRFHGVLHGRRVWNVNSTAKGGGVAEMLNALLPYAQGAGIEARWTVIEGDDDFFRVTKRIHNHLHGAPGDSPRLADGERAQYERVTAARAEELCARLEDDDVVVLHDPQTAGLIPALCARGVPVVWRCHVGVHRPDDLVRGAWRFLMPYVAQADAYVFTRRAYAWEGLDTERMAVIPPSIDPFSPKNAHLDDEQVCSILSAAGITAGNGSNSASYVRQHGATARIEHRASVLEEAPVHPGTPLVLQVSRWDRLKDPAGVMHGFVRGVAPHCDAHLMLAGPSVDEVADDPEGAQTYGAVRREWEALPAHLRARVHLACLPMHDDEENAVMVNALQRRAAVVVQKSLAEGFGLTVAEAMWKGRAVVASRIGGIQDQVEHGVSGLLVDDPRDLARYGEAVCGLLLDGERARSIAEAARDRVREHYLGSRHLVQFAELLGGLVDRPQAMAASV